LTNNVRTQGETMYIAEATGAQNPANLGTVLGLIDLLTEGTSGLPLDKLANWVAQADSTASQSWFSSSQICYYLLSLAVYDSAVQNTNPNIDVSVYNSTTPTATVTLFTSLFNSPLDIPITKDYYFEDISSITFQATGTGEASIVFGATFIPAAVNTAPIYRGIQVNKVIQHIDPDSYDAVGGAITSASSGDIVRITIEVTMPDYTDFLVVTDPFPGAMQPLDPNVYTYIPQPTPILDYSMWWMPPVTTQYLPDKVTFLAGAVYAGTQTFSYVALVNSDGEFLVSPAIAYDQSQPEVMGLSGAYTFITKYINATATSPNSNTCFNLVNRVLDLNSVPSGFGGSAIQSASSSSHHLVHPIGLSLVMMVMLSLLSSLML